jgi:large subunit ribosomal protein L10
MTTKKKNHFRKWREAELQNLNGELPKNDIVALVDLTELPASAAKNFREILKKLDFNLKVTRRILIQKALEKIGYKEVSEKAIGAVGIIFGNGNPFTLFNEIKKNASASLAKVGMVATDDIIIPEGETDIPPGPALSDFKAVRIDTQIRNGHIYVTKDTRITKKGDIIDAKAVAILGKLNIKPVKVLLKIVGAYSKPEQVYYASDVLNIDYDKVRDDFKNSYSNTYLLALGLDYICSETIKPMLSKGVTEAKALAIGAEIVNKDTVKDLIIKAHRISNVLGSKTPN